MRIIDGNIFEGMRMIIPEHREVMQKLEQEKKIVQRPLLDQDKLEFMSQMITEAIQDERCVTVTIFTTFGNQQVNMIPRKVDPYARVLLGDFKTEKVSVRIADIMDIRY